MLEKPTHGAEQARRAGGFVSPFYTFTEQRLQVVALRARQRELPTGQPLHQHGKIAPIGAERILGQIFFQPQRVEKLFNECEILFHISPFDSAVRPLCLIVTGFWYTTRKVNARIEIVTR